MCACVREFVIRTDELNVFLWHAVGGSSEEWSLTPPASVIRELTDASTPASVAAASTPAATATGATSAHDAAAAVVARPNYGVPLQRGGLSAKLVLSAAGSRASAKISWWHAMADAVLADQDDIVDAETQAAARVHVTDFLLLAGRQGVDVDWAGATEPLPLRTILRLLLLLHGYVVQLSPSPTEADHLRRLQYWLYAQVETRFVPEMPAPTASAADQVLPEPLHLVRYGC